MKALLRCSWMIGVLLAGLSSTSWSQSDLENILKQYESESAKGYIQPMADLFGANMNAGLYHSAAIPQTGFSLEIAVIGMGSSVGDDQKTYTLDLPPKFHTANDEGADDLRTEVNPGDRSEWLPIQTVGWNH